MRMKIFFRILAIQFRRLYYGLFRRKDRFLMIKSKEYHINKMCEISQSKGFRKEVLREVTIRLTPIKKNLGTLAGGKVQEVPMSIMILRKNLSTINIEIEK